MLTLLILVAASWTTKAAAHCEILTIQASNEGRGIDVKLSRYSDIFKKKPFENFDTFVLLGTQDIKIELKSPVNLRLPPGISGSLALNRMSQGKLDLTLTLSRSDKPPIRINGISSPNSPIFAAGMKSPEGIWIFGVACDPEHSGIVY